MPITAKPTTTKPTSTGINSSLKPSTTTSCCADRSQGYQSCKSDAWCNNNMAQCATCGGLFASVPIVRTGCCTWWDESCQTVDPTTNLGCHYRQADCEGDFRGKWKPI
jgi:hypothetical protein